MSKKPREKAVRRCRCAWTTNRVVSRAVMHHSLELLSPQNESARFRTATDKGNSWVNNCWMGILQVFSMSVILRLNCAYPDCLREMSSSQQNRFKHNCSCFFRTIICDIIVSQIIPRNRFLLLPAVLDVISYSVCDMQLCLIHDRQNSPKTQG